MGLFDEIERNIRNAIDEAKKAQQPTQEQRQQPAPRPVYVPPPVVAEEQPVENRSVFERSVDPARALPPAAIPAEHQIFTEDGTPLPESLRHERLRLHKEARLKEDAVLKQQNIFEHQFSDQSAIKMVRQLLRSQNGLAAAYIAQEILGPPLALRKRQRRF